MNMSHQVVPYDQMRYRSAGDYWWEPNQAQGHIQVADTGNALYNFLLDHHEYTEMLLVRAQGKPDLSTEFDIPYEQAREAGTVAPCGCRPTATSEPGDDIHAPYHREHQMAEKIEYLLALFLGVDWDDYAAAVERLG